MTRRLKQCASLVGPFLSFVSRAFLSFISLGLYAAGLLFVLLLCLYLQLPGIPPPDDPAAVASAFDLPDTEEDGMTTEIRWLPLTPEALPDHLLAAVLAANNPDYLEHDGLYDGPMLFRVLNPWQNGSFHYCAFDFAHVLAQKMIRSHPDANRIALGIAGQSLLTLKITRTLSRRDIVRLYLDTAYFGHAAYGAEAAARFYFRKPASALVPAESALLAALSPAPSRADPFKRPEHALERRNHVLRRMLSLAWLTRDEYDAAMARPLPVANRRAP